MAQRAGILWVASDIVAPGSLSVKQFDAWYEEDHALEVLALPGVPAATRYTALPPASPSTHGHPPHLITYSFPSLAYAQDPAFLAIAGAEPDAETVGRVYAHAVFDVRFYAELAAGAAEGGAAKGGDPADGPAASGPATNGARDLSSKQTVVASITLSPPPPTSSLSTPSSPDPTSFETWLTTTLPTHLSSLPSFLTLTPYALVSAAARDRNVMVPRDAPGYLLMATFQVSERDGDEELERLREGVEGVVGGAAVVGEVGWFGVKRVWGGEG